MQKRPSGSRGDVATARSARCRERKEAPRSKSVASTDALRRFWAPQEVKRHSRAIMVQVQPPQPKSRIKPLWFGSAFYFIIMWDLKPNWLLRVVRSAKNVFFRQNHCFFIAFQHFFGLYRLPCKMYMVHEFDRYVPELCTKK